MKYKIISSDLDGTLLTTKKKISNETKEALLYYKNKGYIIVAITARTLNSVKNVIDINIFDYLILNNGTCIYEVKTKKDYIIGMITKELSNSISDEIDDVWQINLCSKTTYYSYKNKVENKPYFIKNIDNIDEIKEEILRMNIFLNNHDKILYYKNLISKKYKDVNCFIMQDSEEDKQWLVVNPIGINKLEALKRLINQLNIKLEEVIFFGDGLNDLEMMGSVGCSVAVSNALKEVKEKAKYITLSNDENGIKVFLDKFLNKRNSARGLLIENNKILLIHRTKNVDGKKKKYYVVPGGGVEDDEGIIETVIREFKEETGLNVKVINNKPLFVYENESSIQYFFLVNRISGILGTGSGEEFNNNNEEYLLKMININDIIDNKINLVPLEIRKKLIQYFDEYNK